MQLVHADDIDWLSNQESHRAGWTISGSCWRRKARRNWHGAFRGGAYRRTVKQGRRVAGDRRAAAWAALPAMSWDFKHEPDPGPDGCVKSSRWQDICGAGPEVFSARRGAPSFWQRPVLPVIVRFGHRHHTEGKIMSLVPQMQFSHVGIFVTDFDKMLDFYTRVLGFAVSDLGEAARNGLKMAFITRDPAEHHQIVLAPGRPADAPSQINQLSFRMGSLSELRRMHDIVR